MTKVLVVDDSALMRKLLGKIFTADKDMQVQFARNGVEALALLDVFKPDVVTLDIHMPEMDGLECLDRIMVEHPCPVVMVSSMTADGAETTLEALRLGAVDFIAKPEGAISLHIEDLTADLLAKVAAHQRAERRADVDAHVENGEGAVTPRIIRRIELVDDHRHVRLEVPGAEHDQHEPADEHGHAEVVRGQLADAGGGEHHMAERDEQAADEHRAMRAEHPVGDQAAGDR